MRDIVIGESYISISSLKLDDRLCDTQGEQAHALVHGEGVIFWVFLAGLVHHSVGGRGRSMHIVGGYISMVNIGALVTSGVQDGCTVAEYPILELLCRGVYDRSIFKLDT